MLPPNNVAIRQLSQEEGISEATLRKWGAEARGKGQLLPDADAGPEGWSSRDKFAASLNGADLSEYCRTRGLYPAQIAAWRSACEQANDWDRSSSARISQVTREEKKRIKDLERDLARKDRALAETAKVGNFTSALLGKFTPALTDEAVIAGARRAKACAELRISDRTLRRWTKDGQVHADQRPLVPRPEPRNKLSTAERAAVLEDCNAEAFASLPPSQIVPKLANQGRYLASESSFYRILRAQGQKHYRGRTRPPVRRKPPTSNKASAPCEVWTWDIIWMPGPVAGMFFYLYLIVDIYSRRIVGWEVHERESADLAAMLIRQAVLAEGCTLRPLVLRADNGSPMKGATMKVTMEKPGITASYSSPRVSVMPKACFQHDDNPFSEALFRTCKYRPDWPTKGFATKAEHLHSVIRFVKPDTRHAGHDRATLANCRARLAQPRNRSQRPQNQRRRVKSADNLFDKHRFSPK